MKYIESIYVKISKYYIYIMINNLIHIKFNRCFILKFNILHKYNNNVRIVIIK